MSPRQEFFRFCVVGGLGVAIDMLVVIISKENFFLDTRLCACLGYLLALHHNFILNRFWSFPGLHQKTLLLSYLWYWLSCIGGLLVRLIVIQIFISVFIIDAGWGYIFSNLSGIAAGTVVNFIGAKYLAFNRR